MKEFYKLAKRFHFYHDSDLYLRVTGIDEYKMTISFIAEFSSEIIIDITIATNLYVSFNGILSGKATDEAMNGLFKDIIDHIKILNHKGE